MFENLRRSQPDLSDQLTYQIQSNTFSQVNLFGGSRYSLRMTTALEVSRVLSCTGDKRDDCNCEHCRQFRLLNTSNVVIISQRDHQSVIETAINSFVRLRNDFSRQFLIRNIRILLLQYHGSLMFSGQNKTQSANYDAASEVNDLLLALAGNKQEITEKEAKAVAQNLRTALKSLYVASRKNTTISVNQVRSLDEWIRETSMGSQKRFIIIESLEQTNASARNSLLKMLEEPPSDVYFFLISEYPGRIMQTILSRVRKYAFPPLSNEKVDQLLMPFFLGNEHFATLEHFFLQGGGLDLKKNEEQVDVIVNSLVDHVYLSGEQLNDLLTFVDSQESYEYLLKALLDKLGLALVEQVIDVEKAGVYSRLISESFSNASLYNQNKKLMLESLYFKLMEVA